VQEHHPADRALHQSPPLGTPPAASNGSGICALITIILSAGNIALAILRTALAQGADTPGIPAQQPKTCQWRRFYVRSALSSGKAVAAGVHPEGGRAAAARSASATLEDKILQRAVAGVLNAIGDVGLGSCFKVICCWNAMAR
jgi:hypothetical protein